MTTKEAIAYFGSIKALADELKVWPQTVYQWGERPPLGRQYELELKTRGELRAEANDNEG